MRRPVWSWRRRSYQPVLATTGRIGQPLPPFPAQTAPGLSLDEAEGSCYYFIGCLQSKIAPVGLGFDIRSSVSIMWCQILLGSTQHRACVGTKMSHQVFLSLFVAFLAVNHVFRAPPHFTLGSPPHFTLGSRPHFTLGSRAGTVCGLGFTALQTQYLVSGL